MSIAKAERLNDEHEQWIKDYTTVIALRVSTVTDYNEGEIVTHLGTLYKVDKVEDIDWYITLYVSKIEPREVKTIR